jgi:hypothetical protein
MLDLTKKAEELFNPELSTGELLVKLNLDAYKHYVEESTSNLMAIRKAMEDKPFNAKQILDDIIKDNNEQLRKRCLDKPKESPLFLV